MASVLIQFLKLRLLTFILMIHDLWVDICAFIYRMYMSFATRIIDYSWVPNDQVVFARSVQCCVISTADTQNPESSEENSDEEDVKKEPIKESNDNPEERDIKIEIYTDITYLIKTFYIFDSIQSVASLYRWLGKFIDVEPVTYVEIIYSRREQLYAVRIDLNEDHEMFNNVEIPYGSMELDTLPLRWCDIDILQSKTNI